MNEEGFKLLLTLILITCLGVFFLKGPSTRDWYQNNFELLQEIKTSNEQILKNQKVIIQLLSQERLSENVLQTNDQD